MNILVTGGAGFIGSNLTRCLLNEGHQVTITSTGSEINIPNVKILYTNFIGLDWRKLEKYDVVFHQMANNDTLCMDKDEVFRANVEGPIQLFKICADKGCRNFVYASSTAIFGHSSTPFREDSPLQPLNVYAESKIAFEEAVAKHNWDASVIGLRYCNVYGHGEEHKGPRMSMVGQLIRCARQKRIPTLFEWGEQRRDWIYVDDVVDANLLAMNRGIKETTVYNIGTGVEHSFNEIWRMLDSQIEPKYVPCHFTERFQSHTQCDITKAKDELGFNPRFNLSYGISKYMLRIYPGGYILD